MFSKPPLFPFPSSPFSPEEPFLRLRKCKMARSRTNVAPPPFSPLFPFPPSSRTYRVVPAVPFFPLPFSSLAGKDQKFAGVGKVMFLALFSSPPPLFHPQIPLSRSFSPFTRREDGRAAGMTFFPPFLSPLLPSLPRLPGCLPLLSSPSNDDVPKPLFFFFFSFLPPDTRRCLSSFPPPSFVWPIGNEPER